MISLGLDSAGYRRLAATLCMDHNVEIVVSLLDLNRKYKMNLSSRLYDGQVNISASASDSTRSCTLSLWDDVGDVALAIDTDNIGEVSSFYNRMISVTYCVWRYGDTDSVDVPIFCGPIVGTSRDENGFLNLTCMGMDYILRNSAIWQSTSFKAGVNHGTALRTIARNRGGHDKVDFESVKGKFSKDTSYSKETVVWEALSSLARSNSKHLFTDGRGTLRLRTYPGSVAHRFSDGPGGSIVSRPTRDNTDDSIRNTIWVVGAPPEGSKTVPQYTKTLASTHPLSSKNLGRTVDGKLVPRIILEKVDDSSLTTSTKVKEAATNILGLYDDQAVNLRADVLVIPYLEESDTVELHLNGAYTTKCRLIEYTIPFRGPVSSFGSLRNMALA